MSDLDLPFGKDDPAAKVFERLSGRHGGPPLGSAAREATAPPWHGRHRAEDQARAEEAFRELVALSEELGLYDDERAGRVADERWSDPEDDHEGGSDG